MAISLQILIFLALSFLFIFHVASFEALEPTFTTTGLPPPPQTTPPFFTTAPPPPVQDLHDQSVFSHSSLLAPILSHLGFNELATAAPALSTDSATTGWSGPFTLFAPSDSSIRTCVSCSVPSLLREHVVPGLFTIDYLRKLAFGTKIETLSPGRCITVTSTSHRQHNVTIAKVFIGGVEITNPDLFNNGLIVIHRIQGYISPLSPFSCDVERMISLSFPFHVDRSHHIQPQQPQQQPAVMRLMLRDAMLRLRNNGFSVVSLAMKVKYAELVPLNNMTIFALDDVSIFSGSHGYIHNVRFHIVPNKFLSIADLEKFPVGSTFPTLERGQSLVVTTSGGGIAAAPMRINYVRIKVPDVMRNLKIVVHALYLPFPHIHPVLAAYDGILGGTENGDHQALVDGACAATEMHGGCSLSQAQDQVKPTVEIEDHHGL